MAKKIIRLTEADLTRLVQRVIKEQATINLPMTTGGNKQVKLQSKGYNMIDTCASMGIKSPGYCDTQGKKPVKSCASLGVKTPGFCYVDSKKPIPNQAPKGKDSIKEFKSSRPLITEAAAQMAIDDAEERIASGEKPDPKIMGQIKQCITTKQLTSLMFLTTGAGAYALGVIAMLIAGGAVSGGTSSVVGFAAGGILALSSIIALFITGLSEKDGGLGADPSRDIKALLSCVKL